MTKPLQDASFYVHTSGWETVWEDPESPRFIVVRNGDMKIHARLKGEAEDSPTIIRYTTDLISYGIKTDEDIDARLTSNESWFWDNNPWFPDVLAQERLDCLRTQPDQYGHIWEGDYATVLTGAYFAKHLQEALEATASLTLEDQRWIYSGTAHALYPDLNKA